VADNLKVIQPQITRHVADADALDHAQPEPGKMALTVMHEKMAGGYIGFVPMKRAAWEAAVSSGALRLLDRDLVERYSHIYATQDLMYDDDVRWLKTVPYRTENFDPAQQKATVAALAGALSEFAGNETIMRDLCREQLPALQKAAQEKGAK
jgi:hypothetical protein